MASGNGPSSAKAQALSGVKKLVGGRARQAYAPAVLLRYPLSIGRPSDRLVAGVITNALTHATSPTPMLLTLAGQRVGIPRWTLSKRELIEAVGAEIGAGSLRFGKAGDWELLRDELNTLEREVRQSGFVSYAAPAGQARRPRVSARALLVRAAALRERAGQARRPATGRATCGGVDVKGSNPCTPTRLGKTLI